MKEHLADTLRFVAPKAWRSTFEICGRQNQGCYPAHLTQGALSNRLQKLRADGFVQCQRRGKEKFWRRA